MCTGERFKDRLTILQRDKNSVILLGLTPNDFTHQRVADAGKELTKR